MMRLKQKSSVYRFGFVFIFYSETAELQFKFICYATYVVTCNHEIPNNGCCHLISMIQYKSDGNDVCNITGM